MPTQYVNKATLNGTTTVYWTTTGAADGTGAQSGYNPANLTNIGVDYTTVVETTTTGGNTLSNGGWTTALDLDFTAQPSQTLSTNTTYTIAGKTWTKYNSANDSVAMAITNGTGLVVQPNNSSTDYNMTGGGGRSAPLLGLPLNSIIPNFNTRMRLRIWVYISSENNAAQYDNALFGVDVGAGSVSYVGQRGNGTNGNPGFNGQMYFNASGGGFFGRTQTLSSSNNVVMMEIPVLGDPIEMISAGSWGTDWPDISAMTDMTAYQFSGTVNASTLTASNAMVFLGAMRYQSATSTFAVTFARIKVEYISTVPQTIGTICTSGTYANLPTAGVAGRLYLPTDSNIIFRDNGTTWNGFGPIVSMTPPPAISSWTNFNMTQNFTQSSAPSVTTVGSALLLSAPSSGSNQDIQGLEQTITAPKTVTACFTPRLSYSNYSTAGIFFRDSASTKITFFVLGYSGGTIGFDVGHYTGPSDTGHTDQGNGNAGAPQIQIPIWFKMIDDGTNITYLYSYDGISYITQYTETRAAFIGTPNRVGFATNTYTASSAILLHSWKVE